MTVGKPKETAKTLRDEIAMAAMQRMLPWDHAYPDERTAAEHAVRFVSYSDNIARTAYAIADAMLRVRLERR
jgi:hypothetical protein